MYENTMYIENGHKNNSLTPKSSYLGSHMFLFKRCFHQNQFLYLCDCASERLYYIMLPSINLMFEGAE